MTRLNDKGERRIVDFPPPDSIEAQAARWLAILDADEPPPEKIEAFKAWINQKEAHRTAFEALLALWDDMNILTQTVPPRREAVRRTSPVHAWPRRIVASLAVATAMVVALVIVVRAPEPSIYATGIGEQRAVELADGTSVLLNTNSRLEIAYSDHIRGVTLHHGEALFQIAKDPQRPFEVHAGSGTIRALGTAFTVHLRDMDVEVLVTEGVVEIEKNPVAQGAAGPKTAETTLATPQGAGMTLPAAAPAAISAQVSAGTKAVFSRTSLDEVTLAKLEMPRLESRLAWRHGVLAFDQEPLENVVREMARYTSLKLVIPNKSLRAMKIGGIFKLGDTDALLGALHQGFGIQSARISDDLVYLIASDDATSLPQQ